MGGFVKKCPCLKPPTEEVHTLDYRHCGLSDVPGEVFNFERTLEELIVDANQIRDLPRELFYCHGLRKLSISDNEISVIPPAIASLINLEEFDLSKNGIIDIPDNIKGCKHMRVIDASVNPLGKLPDGFTQLLNLTQLYLNDTFLDYLPGNFGRLSKLKILELRENHLKTLPKSFSRLTELERLDIGNNEFNDLPDVIGHLVNLLELWCDSNQIHNIEAGIGNLKQLMFLDASHNKLQLLPEEISECSSLADLHLTSNRLQLLPESLGSLSNLTTLKVDDNHLTALPHSFGGLTALSELNVSSNDLECFPSSIGRLRNLRTIYADDNFLEYLPAEMGSCNGITVLSVRGNKISYIPDELGRIPRLRVLNLSDNRIQYLPFSFIKLKELQALWLTENQTKPLIPLQTDKDHESGRKVLTCYLLPQSQEQNEVDDGGDADSFHPSVWEDERMRRQQIHFKFADQSDEEGKLKRCPTPYPKEMKDKLRNVKNLRQVLSSSSGGRKWHSGHENHGYEPGSGQSLVIDPDNVTLGVDNKPSSPTLHDSHKLLQYDKQKQAKDKARLQHKQVSPDEMDQSHQRLAQAGHGDQSDTPISIGTEKTVPNRKKTYLLAQDPNYSHRMHYHNSPHSNHDSRRTREYDSEVEYSSIRDSSRRRQMAQSGYSSDIGPSSGGRNGPSKHYSNRLDRSDRGGYSSDMGGSARANSLSDDRSVVINYSRKSDGYASDRGANSSHRSHRDRSSGGCASDIEGYPGWPNTAQHLQNANSLPYDLNNTSNVLMGPVTDKQPYFKRTTIRNDELYLAKSAIEGKREDSSVISPDQFQPSECLDHSTPKIPEHDWRKQLYTVLEQKQRLQKAKVDEGHMTEGDERLFQKDASLNTLSSFQTIRSDHQHKFNHPTNNGAPSETLRYPGNASAAPDTGRYPSANVSRPGHNRNLPNMSDSYPSPPSSSQGQLSTTVSFRQHPVSILPLQNQKQNLPSDTPAQNHWKRPESQRPHHATPVVNSGSVWRPTDNGVPTESSRPHSEKDRVSRTSSDSQYSAKNSPRSQASDLDRSTREFRGNRSSKELSEKSRPLSHGAEWSQYRHSSSAAYMVAMAPKKSDSRHSYHDSFSNHPTYGNNASVSNYDSVSVYRTEEPSQVSQVSSSNDSGYGQLPDRTVDRRASGAYKSDQSNGDSVLHSASQPPSREVTPIRYIDASYDSQDQVHNSILTEQRSVFKVSITKQKDYSLGFSIAGGKGNHPNPYREDDQGIFVSKVSDVGPAAMSLRRGDKILEVNDIDFAEISHDKAVAMMKNCSAVSMRIERLSTSI